MRKQGEKNAASKLCPKNRFSTPIYMYTRFKLSKKAFIRLVMIVAKRYPENHQVDFEVENV